MTMKVLGINDDVTTCECCGRPNLKATVVLETEHGDIRHYGRDCAARSLMGNNKSGSVKSVETLAKGISYARKWLNATPAHTARVVFNRVNLFCRCWVVGDTIHFPNGIVVS
jgi:hypothetical protein